MIEIRKILAKIAPNGREQNAAKLRATIGDLEAQLSEANRFVLAADARANALLLEDKDDEVEALEREVRERQRDIEKIEAVLPGLYGRLTAATAYEKRASIAKHQRKIKVATEAVRTAVRAALDANAALAAARQDAFRDLGAAIGNVVFPDTAYRGMVNELGFEDWSRFVNDALAKAPADWPRSAPPAALAVSPKSVVPASPLPSTNGAKPATIASGEVEIIIGPRPYTNGPTGAGAETWQPGERILVAPGWATRLVAGGHAQYAAAPSGRAWRPGQAPPVRIALPPRSALPDQVPDGFMRVEVMRSGYCDGDGKQCQRGDLLDQPIDTARAAIANGAVDAAPIDVVPAESGEAH